MEEKITNKQKGTFKEEGGEMKNELHKERRFFFSSLKEKKVRNVCHMDFSSSNSQKKKSGKNKMPKRNNS